MTPQLLTASAGTIRHSVSVGRSRSERLERAPHLPNLNADESQAELCLLVVTAGLHILDPWNEGGVQCSRALEIAPADSGQHLDMLAREHVRCTCDPALHAPGKEVIRLVV